MAELETRLGVRLLQRTTRRLSLTEIGGQYYQHCQAMLAEAEAADEAVLHSSAEPRGLIRVSCPELLCKTMLSLVLPRFLALHPQVRVTLDSTNRRVDLVEEGVDVAIRVRNVIEDSASLVVRRLGRSRVILVASPAFLEIHGEPKTPERLAALPALTMSRPDGRGQWVLLDNVGQSYTIHLDAPRLMTDDMIVLLEAAAAGVGVAALPANVCHQALADGRLRQDVPQRWTAAAHPAAVRLSLGHPARRIPHPPRLVAGGARLHRFRFGTADQRGNGRRLAARGHPPGMTIASITVSRTG
ncbi:LysR family transcriptional regulator [Chromobacterium piscinae]|uniref:LysR family transcriptional regulator n=1 Tax=Chromobacterium piscinae TaxID=686831 RepID=UPI0031FCE9BD